ncbi:MAG: DNA-processing protein DprA [Bacteroidales bacterium]|jgi:DNA processing protein
MDCNCLVYACALSKIFAYKCIISRQLIDSFDDISDIFNLNRKELYGILPNCALFIEEILNHKNLEWAYREIKWAKEFGIDIYYINDQKYPYRLKECYDAPIILYYKGNADINSSRILSIVGTRKATYYGKETCRKIVEQLSFNSIKPLIVSGLAYGIDAMAHRTALELGLETIGVMATGLDTIYPQAHRELGKRILEHGGLLTDFTSNTDSLPINFVRRNRIIAGMSDAVLLVESASKGGGIITANLAHSYSKEIFAVPGRISDNTFEGCNRLIGANIANAIVDYNTIEKVMKWEDIKWKKIIQKKLFYDSDNEIKKKIITLLKIESPLSIEKIFELAEIPINELTLNLLELELENRIITLAGNNYGLV